VRIVSLLPAATEIVFALGLGDELAGVTDACTFPAEARGLPVVARTTTDPRAGATGPRDAAAPALRLILDDDALAAAEPDLVITGGAASAESVGYREASDAVARLGLEAEVIRLAPTSVEGVLNAIQAIGAMTETEDEAMDVALDLRERLHALEKVVLGRREHGFEPPRVIVLEGVEPPVAVGRWVPEQVRLAGGWELLGREGEAPASTTWGAVREMEPEVLVLALRGCDLVAVREAWDRLPRPAGWETMPAVAAGRVFAVDGPACFDHPGPRVIDGIEVLAELIDPAAFDGMAPPDTWTRLA
jgi:iron complex transport system substrate-binding protein